MAASYEEMRRIIREEEPARPSLRVSTISDPNETANFTTTHGSEPEKLSRQLRGDLDWIVMKAIEKDRSRRYETANALSADITRFLNNEPVSAAAPSVAYQVRKFAVRNKGLIATGSLIAAVLIVATIVSVHQAIRATDAESLALERLRESEQARTEAEIARGDAESVSQYLIDLFRSPLARARGREVTVAEILDRAVEKLNAEGAGDDPKRKAHLQFTIGCSYYELGLFEESIQLLEQSVALSREVLGPTHPTTLQRLFELKWTYGARALPEKAAPVNREILEGYSTILRQVRESPDSSPAEVDLAIQKLMNASEQAGKTEQAIQLAQELVERLKTRNEAKAGEKLLKARRQLALSYCRRKDPAEGVAMMEKVIEEYVEVFGANNRLTLASMERLGEVHFHRKEWQRAVYWFTRIQARRKQRKWGPELVYSSMRLADSYAGMRNYERAVAIGTERLAFAEKIKGPDHEYVLRSMVSLAKYHSESGNLAKASEQSRKAYHRFRDRIGLEHKEIQEVLKIYAHSIVGNADQEKVDALVKDLLGQIESDSDPVARGAVELLKSITTSQLDQGLVDEAFALGNQVIESCKIHRGLDHIDTFAAMDHLADLYDRNGENSVAIKNRLHVLAARRNAFGELNGDVIWTRGRLGELYEKGQYFDLAIEQYREMVAARRKREKDHPKDVAWSLIKLGEALHKSGQSEEAVPIFEEVLDRRLKIDGKDSQDTLDSMERLADAYRHAGRNEQAEAMEARAFKARQVH